ncbi:RdxH [Roseivivax halodurans JCM 10272]|uniref:RdxH n=1 Tax=Roseivivax halodurans JCM 10272 TaxID=1449350 RepID=X7EKX4_9RHOB|nr:FixH family protein [Roseivivax halodurans]ETX15816.1 RdxH [Roseivivax halodurans JCM 10272]
MFVPMTGRKVFALFALGFGTIIAVNVALAVSAVRTFPGLEVKNSYVASQHFDEERAAQEALGWQAETHVDEGRLVISLTGEDGGAVKPRTLSVTIGRPTTDADDRELKLVRDGTAYVAGMPSGVGAWQVRIAATSADGTPFRQRITIWSGSGK